MEDLASAPHVEEVAPPDVLTFLEGNQQRMRRFCEEVENLRKESPVRPYVDPRLSRNQKAYARLIKRMSSVGM